MRAQQIMATLEEMALLLRIGGLDDWARQLQSLYIEYARDPEGTAWKIVSLYGGMGSINDLVLYKDGLPLIDENNRFFELKSKLYSICHG